MREEWIKELYRNGFKPVKDTDRSVWSCAFTTRVGRIPDIVARMWWVPKSCTCREDEWTLEFVFAGNGHRLYALASATFSECMQAVVAGPMQKQSVAAYIEGYCTGTGRHYTPVYRKAEPVKEPDKNAGRCAWDVSKERLLSEGWKDAGTPNLEYTSAYCGLGYTIRATMQDDGKFSVCYWGDTGATQGGLGLSLDDVSAMAKKTLYELMPGYVENCTEQLRKAVATNKCADEYFKLGERCHILPPGVPDEWLDKLHEKGFAIGDTKVTAYKNVNMLNGKAYKVIVTLTGTGVHVEITDDYQTTPVVDFGVNYDNLNIALTKATEWLITQSREA